MSKRFLPGLMLLAFCPLLAGAGDLGVGDNAPQLEVKEYVKGEPVKSFAKGQVYVVEFWATWCGPCRATIPHLSKLQKEHGQKVVVIGVAVHEEEPDKVAPFVKEMGEKMEYRVALDKVADKQESSEGAMAKNWLAAAEQDGIPSAFIVNGDGKIAWIGHPAELDKPLEEVVGGKFDLAKAAAAFKKEKEQKTKLRALTAKLRKASEEGNAAVIKVVDEAIKEMPELADKLGMFKFNTLMEDEGSKPEDITRCATFLVDQALKDNAPALNNVAWMLIDPESKRKPDKAQIDLALKAARRADELAKGEEAAVADTLARAYHLSGDSKKALETQERACKLAKGTPSEAELNKRLEEYKKGSAKK
jgi:thiol-disulfide isomerase/thioredoxin/ribosomal protein L18E